MGPDDEVKEKDMTMTTHQNIFGIGLELDVARHCDAGKTTSQKQQRQLNATAPHVGER